MKRRSYNSLIGILVLCISLPFFAGCSSSGGAETDGQAPSVSIVRKPAKPAAEAEEEAEKTEGDDTLYIVQEMRTDEEKIVLRSIDTDRSYLFPYSLATRFLDKYGDTTSSLNFTVGSVVTIGDKLASQALSYIQKAKEVWEFDDVSDYDLDTELGLLTIGEEKYRTTDGTVVYSNGIVSGLTDIGSEDVLQIIGRDNKIITISVTTGHGYLALINTEKFEDSLLSIGNKMFTMVTPDLTITVPEGTYFVTAANNGYGGTTLVEIIRNETTVLDMAELEGEGPKVCKLTLNTTVEGAEIFIDGQAVNVGEETEIEYGKHTITVYVQGYSEWKRTLFVNSETANITIDPTEGDETAGENTEESKESTDGSTSTNREDAASSAAAAASSVISNTVNGTSGSQNTASSSSQNAASARNQAELDYLSTLSNMIGILGGSN